MPTTFNFLGPLANPARVRRQAVGVSDPAMAATMLGTLRALGTERAMVFSGDDGLDELTTTTTSTVHELIDGNLHEFKIDPLDVGIPRADAEHLCGGDAATNAGVLRDVLAGKSGPCRDIAVLNAAAALMVAGQASDLGGRRRAGDCIRRQRRRGPCARIARAREPGRARGRTGERVDGAGVALSGMRRQAPARRRRRFGVPVQRMRTDVEGSAAGSGPRGTFGGRNRRRGAGRRSRSPVAGGTIVIGGAGGGSDLDARPVDLATARAATEVAQAAPRPRRAAKLDPVPARWIRFALWIVAVPLGFVIVFAFARAVGMLNSNQLQDVVITDGWKPLLAAGAVAAVRRAGHGRDRAGLGLRSHPAARAPGRAAAGPGEHRSARRLRYRVRSATPRRRSRTRSARPSPARASDSRGGARRPLPGSEEGRDRAVRSRPGRPRRARPDRARSRRDPSRCRRRAGPRPRIASIARRRRSARVRIVTRSRVSAASSNRSASANRRMRASSGPYKSAGSCCSA